MDLSNYHPTVAKILDLVGARGMWHETFQHEPVRTSEEASKVRTGYGIHQGAKALIVRVKKSGEKYFVMLVIPGDCKFDRKKSAAVLGSGDIRFASEEEVSHLTDGVLVGGVPPFGNLFGLKVYVDRRVLENEKIIFNAGDRRFSVALLSKEYMELVKSEVVDIVD